MHFELVIIFIVSVSFLFAANVANHVLQIDMNSEFIFVKEIT